jgi:hypothetical protein
MIFRFAFRISRRDRSHLSESISIFCLSRLVSVFDFSMVVIILFRVKTQTHAQRIFFHPDAASVLSHYIMSDDPDNRSLSRET